MSKQLGKDIVDIKQRKQFLKDNCDSIENKGYMKKFKPEELTEMKEVLSELSIQINDINIEKKSANEVFKIQLKPLHLEREELRQNLKQKAKFENEPCFKFIDHENKTVEFYNSEGDMIDCRPINADEMQGTIFQIGRTGTND